jgi:integral membrane protein
VQGALTRYRIIAWIVGVVLVVLVLVGMPLKYLGDNDSVVATVGPIHGFLYMVYLVASFDLGRRARWPLSRMVLVMLAGTIPFFSFWAERAVTRWVTQPAGTSAALAD